MRLPADFEPELSNEGPNLRWGRGMLISITENNRQHEGTGVFLDWHPIGSEHNPCAAIVILFSLMGFIILFFLPDRTGELFAWAVKPHMSSMYFRAAYLGCAWILSKAVSSKHWHRIHVIFPAVTVFTLSILITTILHWDRFAHGTPGFTAWLIFCIISPFLIPAIWIYNQKTQYRISYYFSCDKSLVQAKSAIFLS